MRPQKILVMWAAIATLLFFSGVLPLSARTAAARSGEHAAAQPQAPHEQPGAGVHEEAVAEGQTAEGGHEEGWLPLVARLVNFAILVGLLAYFLRSPIASYLRGRAERIRGDLVQAAETRRAAEVQLAAIDERMKQLPAELETLRERGVAEIAAEEARIRAAAEADRDRLLEQMRRAIDMQVRLARRTLLEEVAALATGVARERITRTITPDDQMRLIDRYTRQVAAR